MDKILTKSEAAERIRRPKATLDFWRHKGIGPKSFLLAGRIVYRESDLEAWLDEQYNREHGGDFAAAET
jgi:hypothetical protein